MNSLGPLVQAGAHRFLARVHRDKLHGMHAPLLPEPIDPADALLQPLRRPGELEIDHEPAAIVEIEALAGRVGREEHRGAARRELAEHVGALASRQAAVQPERCEIDECRREMLQRVAVLGEDEHRLACALDQTPQPVNLALAE